jgi:hypothetical protein
MTSVFALEDALAYFARRYGRFDTVILATWALDVLSGRAFELARIEWMVDRQSGAREIVPWVAHTVDAGRREELVRYLEDLAKLELKKS